MRDIGLQWLQFYVNQREQLMEIQGTKSDMGSKIKNCRGPLLKIECAVTKQGEGRWRGA